MIIKIKFHLSFAGGATITDGENNQIYKAKGKVISIFRKKKLYDINGTKLFTIRNKFWHIPLTKAVLIHGSNGIKARVDWNLSRNYVLKNYQDAIEMQGDWFKTNFEIYKNGTVAATGHSEFSLNGCFVIDVINPADCDIIVAFLLAVNNINKNN